jgi:hypothetical protein
MAQRKKTITKKKSPEQRLRDAHKDHQTKVDFLHSEHQKLVDEHAANYKRMLFARERNVELETRHVKDGLVIKELQHKLGMVAAAMATKRLEHMAAIRELERNAFEIGMDLRQL